MNPILRNGIQQGIGITNEVLNAMAPEERDFWKDFLQQGKDLVAARKIGGATVPFEPTDDLRKKHRIAIEQYDGKKYCQVQQLEDHFAF